MVVCLFRARKTLLIDIINRTNLKLMKLMQKRYDLMAYGDAIADGKITWEEMAGMPTAHRMRTNEFIFNSQNPAIQQADALGNMYANGYAQQNAGREDNSVIQEAQYAIKEKAYSQALEQIARQEQEKIHREECKIEQEQKRLESQLTAYQKELEQVEKAEQKAIEFSIVKYVNDGR